MNLLFFAQLLLAGLMPDLSDTLTVSKQDTIEVAVVTGGWAHGQTPVTSTTVWNLELENSNPINSLPMSLALEPSVVVTNEGGTGLPACRAVFPWPGGRTRQWRRKRGDGAGS